MRAEMVFTKKSTCVEGASDQLFLVIQTTIFFINQSFTNRGFYQLLSLNLFHSQLET